MAAAAGDDPRGRTYCERHRHECEVRHVASLEHDARNEYLKVVLAKRGSAAMAALRADVVRLLNARVRRSAERAALTPLHGPP